jgi:MGT family glycosyltransferase
LRNFQVINPTYEINSLRVSKLRLVYVALGTLFNDNIEIYEKILEAIRLIEPQKFHFVIETGGPILIKLKLLIEKDELVLPERVVSVPFAPQIELLKRASLFRTHSGLNSTSESIYYGVPMVCLPIQADQPYVAMRVEELAIGKKLDFKTCDKFQLAEAIRAVFENEEYTRNVIEYSRMSRAYKDGSGRFNHELHSKP